jgi:hypothetical protein
MKPQENGFWRPPPGVRAAINRGVRKLAEYHKRLVARAVAERVAEPRERQ